MFVSRRGPLGSLRSGSYAERYRLQRAGAAFTAAVDSEFKMKNIMFALVNTSLAESVPDKVVHISRKCMDLNGRRFIWI